MTGWVAMIGAISIAVSAGYAGLILALQILQWAKFGAWIAVPAMYLFQGVGLNNPFASPAKLHPFLLVPKDGIGWSWLNDPHEWFGVHRIVVWLLDTFSAGVFVFLATLTICVLLMSWAESVDNRKSVKAG